MPEAANLTNETCATSNASNASGPACLTEQGVNLIGWTYDHAFAVLCVLLVGAVFVVGAVSYARAPAAQRPKALRRLTETLLYLVVVGLISASWIYRPQLGSALVGLWTLILAVYLWYSELAWTLQLAYLGLGAFFVWEVVWLYGYKFLHRIVWRGRFPDLCLIREEFGMPRRVVLLGRLYKKVKPTVEGEPWRYEFVPHHGGAFDWISKRSVLLTSLKLEEVSPREQGVRAVAAQRVPGELRVYTLRDERLGSYPVGQDAPRAIVTENLDANRQIAQEAIEGNPWALYKRADRDHNLRGSPRRIRDDTASPRRLDVGGDADARRR